MSTPQEAPCWQAQVRLATNLCEVVDTPRSLCCWILLRTAEADALLPGGPAEAITEYMDLPAPFFTGDVHRYARDRMVSEILKKSLHAPIGIDTEQAALDTYRANEVACAETNDRVWREEEPSWLPRARAWISRVLGELDMEKVLSLARHGQGATNGVPGYGVPGSLKYDNPCTMTAELVPYAESIMGLHWSQVATPRVVKGSVWSSVPKTAKTERSIATEPTLNMFLQLGLGLMMRHCLLAVGIDLRDQRWNQTLASMAEEWGLATLDLSSASDRIAYEVVRKLLPPRWFAALALCRSGYSNVAGEWTKLAKWSSMGNGYTFPLETLIFASVVRSIVPRRDRCVTAIYGDDIICPQQSAREVIDALVYLGAKVNTSKSFLAGSFFESCGTDFVVGRPCRPIYLTTWKPPIPYAVTMANAIRRWGWACFGYTPEEFRPIWDELISCVRGPWKGTAVPLAYGDSGIIRSAPWKVWRKDGWEGYAVRRVVFVPTEWSHTSRDTVQVLLKAYSRLATGPSESEGWEEDSSRIEDERDALFTLGREPLRGIFGKPIARIGFSSFWTQGLSWL